MAGGRPAAGREILGRLDGSEHAKARLDAVLATISGECGVEDACSMLGVSPTAFTNIRKAALQGALQALEPKPLGRPPRLKTEEDRKLAEYEKRLVDMKREVEAARVREELSLTMPFIGQRRKLHEDLAKLRAGKKGGRSKRGQSGADADRAP